jgi:hypothetical protein
MDHVPIHPHFLPHFVVALGWLSHRPDRAAGGIASSLVQTFEDVAEFLKPHRLHLSRLAIFGTG